MSVALFVATVFTTLAAGAFLAGADPVHDPRALLEGVPFALALLLILGAHELAHYLTSRRHGVGATWPLFLPGVPPAGTFGAIIRITSAIPDRRTLLSIGAAGPLAGFIMALPLAVAGLALSRVETGPLPEPAGGFSLGEPLVFRLLARLVLGPLPEDASLLLHPVAFAAWVGFFVTSLNLLPVGQLDGGHILYALAGRRQEGISRAAVLLLAPLGFFWMGWFLWGALLLLLGIAHPPVLEETTPLAPRHRLLGALSAVLLLLTFTPAPFALPPG